MESQRVKAVQAAGARSLRVTWQDDTEHTVDVSSIIDEFRAFAPLRSDLAAFAAVQVGEWGADVHWPDGNEVHASTLWRLALEQDAARFKAWRKANGLTQEAAGAALGISHRMVKYYEAGTHPIPKTVSLATVGYDTLKQRAA